MKITIIGSGRMATAVSQVLADNNHQVLMWSIAQTDTLSINEIHINPAIEYSRPLSSLISATLDLSKAVKFSSTIIIAIPSSAFTDVLPKVLKLLENTTKYTFINVAKGLIPQSGLYLHSYLENMIPTSQLNFLGSLIGPSYAAEILLRQITYLNLASRQLAKAQKISILFNNRYLHVEPLTYVDEFSFLACYKNVAALFAGILSGLNLKSNPTSVFFVKTLKECNYLLKLLRLNPAAITSYGGIGDLILTCSSMQSRNFRTGHEIGTSNSFSNTLINIKKLNLTVEGIGTAIELKKKLKHYSDLDLNQIPILNAIWQVIHNKPRLREIIMSALHPYASEKANK